MAGLANARRNLAWIYSRIPHFSRYCEPKTQDFPCILAQLQLQYQLNCFKETQGWMSKSQKA
jgi:hypothetical protein